MFFFSHPPLPPLRCLISLVFCVLLILPTLFTSHQVCGGAVGRLFPSFGGPLLQDRRHPRDWTGGRCACQHNFQLAKVDIQED